MCGCAAAEDAALDRVAQPISSTLVGEVRAAGLIGHHFDPIGPQALVPSTETKPSLLDGQFFGKC
jgi:hypothetical protein